MIYKREQYRPSETPNEPGVYVYRDQFSKVIYVGKAKNLRKRLGNYFQASRLKTADPKLRSLINSIAFYELFVVKSESEALLLESRFIKEYAPRYNILMRDDKRFQHIKIDMSENFPRLQLSRLKKDDQNLYFGPFPNATVLYATIDYLTRYFSLRSCSVREPDEETKKHCDAHIIRQCSAPCDQSISKEDYRLKLDELIAVFSGQYKDIIADLEDQMKLEASKQQFEKAAKTRDVIENIRSLFRPQRSFINKTISNDLKGDSVQQLQEILQLEQPPTVIECFDNSNFQGSNAVASMVQFVNGKPNNKAYRHFKIKTVDGIDDFASMHEIVYRRYSRLQREDRDFPDLIIVDGGKGQLSSAVDALDRLGLEIPIFGLAKRNEELYRPKESEPILIEKHKASLRMLMHLRDEAHRFAISFHRKLRQKAIMNSLLDDIEGIGKKRKLDLLKEFGSVKEIRKRTAEEIVHRVNNFPLPLAEKLLVQLKKK